MTDLTPELRSALQHADVQWDQEREDQTWQGLRVKRVRRTVVRSTAAAAAVLLLAAGVWLWQRPDGAAPAPAVADQDQPREVAPAPEQPAPQVEQLAVRLDDGSVITPEDAAAEVEVVADSRERVAVKVVRGKSRFEVPREPDREFTVDAGEVKIAVYSSQFSVARFDNRTEVWADDGYLKIEWEGNVQEVRAGETAEFPPADAIEAPAGGEAVDPVPPRARTRREQVVELMEAADSARQARRPADAVRPLSRVVDKYARDPRAPMAAFTLGRVLLDDLKQPARAAKAFRKARALAPAGPLAEDALAREAEAWAKAGETERARERAARYLDEYPAGHRVPEMRQIVE